MDVGDSLRRAALRSGAGGLAPAPAPTSVTDPIDGQRAGPVAGAGSPIHTAGPQLRDDLEAAVPVAAKFSPAEQRLLPAGAAALLHSPGHRLRAHGPQPAAAHHHPIGQAARPRQPLRLGNRSQQTDRRFAGKLTYAEI